MSEYIQNGTSLYKKVKPNKRVDYKTDIDEFEFESTPETDAMLKQLCVKECFVRCKDCKYWNDGTCEMLGTVHMNAEDFCSRGEKR